ncbi:hypothetical protein DPMN_156385 [Dreissena polymorpha]|uniref:Uncharacterized protein n=1 Tax=Dreissena polymorpha TaxID=45954 RepID=A0A9D4FPR9_DREPO|nr:hypothetical protein DPMN_156385 [Dreissena polymorpha]
MRLYKDTPDGVHTIRKKKKITNPKSKTGAAEADGYPHAACLTQGRPRVGNGPCIVEIDHIVIREVQYQLEVNRLKGNFGWALPMWVGRPRIDRIVIREVQYQFEVNRCRNQEIIVKGNFGWEWPTWAGRPGLVMGPCIAEIDRIVIREIQYQLEVNRCRNEEIIVKGNFGWAWPMWVGRPRIDRIVIREVQYQFEVNQCRNEEIIRGPWLVMGPCIVEIDRIVIREDQYQFEDNQYRNEEIIWPGRTDGRKTEITTISPLFLRKEWG